MYDAVVYKEEIRQDGTVYLLSSLTSRKPPTVAPNWRTSYRLKFNAFVAIVKLDHEGEQLEDSLDIQWAEVSCVSENEGSRDDFKFREQHKMAVRILTKSDCESLVGEADCPLEVGGRVAIIDMRVFVPEVISVLNTFSQPKFEDELSKIPFINSLIGKHVKNDILIEAAAEYNELDMQHRQMSHRDAIKASIFGSDVPFLKQMTEEKKLSLISKLLAIPAIKSLSGTQLDAFAAALASSVHCCQGPPGTGKVKFIHKHILISVQ